MTAFAKSWRREWRKARPDCLQFRRLLRDARGFASAYCLASNPGGVCTATK